MSQREEGPRYTVEIDTGGTFTDGYVADGKRMVTAKADTTPYDLATGVLACVDRAAEHLGITRAELLQSTDAFRLSTTVGTNTLINRSGPAVGLLLGSESAPVIAQLDPGLPLDPELVATVPEGDMDSASVRHAVRRLLDSGARVLVIALSDGPDLALRENAIRAMIAEFYPRHYLGAVPVLPSHQVTPLDDARLRVQTTALSAYLHPVMSAFLYRVEEELRADGYSRPLLVADASGGTSRVAKSSALRTWGSGPAGGVAATAALAAELDLPLVVGFDVGGTSTDICVIADGQWRHEIQPRIEGIEVALPALSLVSAPIGGGTIARIADGELTLGPDSAGAQPGPACFGLGGDQVTVTDAVCHLGLFDPDNFLGGHKRLDVSAASAALEALASSAGQTTDDLAFDILKGAGKLIAEAIEAQLEIADATAPVSLFATGGAGGMLAGFVHLATRPYETFAFPISPVFSAFGLSQLDVRHAYEAVSTSPTLEADLEALRERAFADMLAEGFMRHEVHLTEETEIVDSSGGVRVASGRVDSDADGGRARLVRLNASTKGRRAIFPRAGSASAETVEMREVRWPESPQKTPVFAWADLPADTTIDGPAILETDETTLAVPPEHAVHIGCMGEARLTTP